MANIMVERKTERKYEKGKTPTYHGPQAQLTSPAAQARSPLLSSSQARQAARWRACRRRRLLLAYLEPSQTSISHHGENGGLPRSLSPSSGLSLAPLCSISMTTMAHR